MIILSFSLSPCGACTRDACLTHFFDHPFRDTLLIARCHEEVFESSVEDDRRRSDFSADTRVQRSFAVDRPPCLPENLAC